MTNAPFMPKATAVWLVENTTLTFKQIAEFCNLHELEIKGIADGDVAKGIKAYNPILAGQLSREEIEKCSKDPLKKLELIKKSEDEMRLVKSQTPEENKEMFFNEMKSYLTKENTLYSFFCFSFFSFFIFLPF